jgi:hypothetical protein
MLIWIVTLVLAVAVIVATRVLLNYHDARLAAGRSGSDILGGADNGNKKAFKIMASKKIVSAETIWGIDDIRQGVIIAVDGRYGMLLKIGPIDFHMMNSSEQSAVESALMSTAMAIDSHLQFFSTVELCDTKGCALAISDALNSGDLNKDVTDYAINMYNHLDSLMQNRSIHNRSRYIAVTYYTLAGFDHARKEILRIIQVLANSLLRARINVELVSSDQAVDIFFRFCNRGRMLNPSESVAAGALDLYVTGKGVYADEASL